MILLLHLFPAAVAALCRRRQPPPVVPPPRGLVTTQWHLRPKR